jgi:hypothetical protein
LRTTGSPSSRGGVLHPFSRPLLSWVSSLPRRSGRSGWLHLSKEHPLLAFASGPFSLVPEVSLQRLSARPPGVPCSRRCRPS